MVEPRLTRIYYTIQLSPVIFPDVHSPYPSHNIIKNRHFWDFIKDSVQKQTAAISNSFSKNGQCAQKKKIPSSHSWHSPWVGLLFSSSLHIHSQRRLVWKEEEKKHLNPALRQEWEEGNVFFPDAFSVFYIRWYTVPPPVRIVFPLRSHSKVLGDWVGQSNFDQYEFCRYWYAL